MRILNIGVIVCVGGILAALPFRHSKQAAKQAEHELRHPARATGPTIAMDDAHSFPHQSMTDLMMRPVESPGRAPAVPLEELIAFEAPKVESAEPPRRPLDLPKTYDELAVPVMPSTLLQDRFNAIADSPSVATGPAIDPPSQRLPPEWSSPGELFANQRDQAAGPGETNLISAPLPQPDPAADPAPNRQRHWIRQP